VKEGVGAGGLRQINVVVVVVAVLHINELGIRYNESDAQADHNDSTHHKPAQPRRLHLHHHVSEMNTQVDKIGACRRNVGNAYFFIGFWINFGRSCSASPRPDQAMAGQSWRTGPTAKQTIKHNYSYSTNGAKEEREDERRFDEHMEDVNLTWLDMFGNGMGVAVVALAIIAVVFFMWWPAKAAKEKLDHQKTSSGGGSAAKSAGGSGALRRRKVED
jgi:hypothetical protein